MHREEVAYFILRRRLLAARGRFSYLLMEITITLFTIRFTTSQLLPPSNYDVTWPCNYTPTGTPKLPINPR